jgi:dihydrofolate reductase
MGKLLLSVAATVDGVIDGFEWFVSEGEHDAASRAQFEGAAGMVLGRKTYEGLAGFWPTQEGPWADLINPLPKLVASRTLSGSLEWNATVLEGALEAAIPRLKDESSADLLMSGCGELARNLLEAGLLDEIRLWLHPVVWGQGTRPFQGRRTGLRLLEAQRFDSGVTLLRYEPR